jgi:hypothetical protein
MATFKRGDRVRPIVPVINAEVIVARAEPTDDGTFELRYRCRWTDQDTGDVVEREFAGDQIEKVPDE